MNAKEKKRHWAKTHGKISDKSLNMLRKTDGNATFYYPEAMVIHYARWCSYQRDRNLTTSFSDFYDQLPEGLQSLITKEPLEAQVKKPD